MPWKLCMAAGKQKLTEILIVGLFVSFDVKERISVPEFCMTVGTTRHLGGLRVLDEEETVTVAGSGGSRRSRESRSSGA